MSMAIYNILCKLCKLTKQVASTVPNPCRGFKNVQGWSQPVLVSTGVCFLLWRDLSLLESKRKNTVRALLCP